MLKVGQSLTPTPASPPSSSAAKDASKHIKEKHKVVEESSLGVKISLSAGVSAFKHYKALIQGADQFILPHNAQLLRDSGVLNTIDQGITSTFQVEQEREEKLEALEKQVVVLSANDDRLRMEHKVEVDNLLSQVSTLIEKCETIADDAVLKRGP
ncbi:hypothetical protein ACOSQ2_017090 [Xanthoceras sorbifolium]